jgi:hypothetical protein
MSFRVVVATYVPYTNSSDGDVPLDDPGDFVQRIVELPFPPFEGLSLHDGDWHCGSITSVTYHIDRGIFDAHTDDGAEARNRLSFDAAIKTLREKGWKDKDPLLTVGAGRPPEG